MDNSMLPLQLRTTDNRHMQIPQLGNRIQMADQMAGRLDGREVGKNEASSGSGAGSGVKPTQSTSDFLNLVQAGLQQVENLDRSSNHLTAKSVIDPDSVEAYEVVIAAQKASFALNLTKTLSEGFIRSYRELTSLR